MKKILISTIAFTICSGLSSAENLDNIEKTNPSLFELLTPPSETLDTNDIYQDIESLKNVLINPFKKSSSQSNNLLQTSLIKILDIEIERFEGTSGSMRHNIKAILDGYDPAQHQILWKINGLELTGIDIVNLDNTGFLKDGDNNIELDIFDKSNGRNIATLIKNFNIIENMKPKITSADAVKIKYSDGFHYSLTAKFKNLPDNSKIIWKLNDTIIDNPNSIEAKEGINQFKVFIEDNNGIVLDQATRSFGAYPEPIHISHLLTIMGSDDLHYNIVGLYTSYNEKKHNLIYKLNGKAIINLDNVQFPVGKNTISLSIEDKITHEVLAEKSKTLDTTRAVGISFINTDEIENSDGFHFKLSADYINFNPNIHEAIWAIGDRKLDPENAQLKNGNNRIVLYIYDKETGELLAASNIKVDIAIDEPKIKNIHITAKSEGGLAYTLSADIDNFNNNYYQLWVLNGDKLDTLDISANDGNNLVGLSVINRYTNETIDYRAGDFVAKKLKPIFPTSVTYNAPMMNSQSTYGSNTGVLNGISWTIINDQQIKFDCPANYGVVNNATSISDGQSLTVSGDTTPVKEITISSWGSKTRGWSLSGSRDQEIYFALYKNNNSTKTTVSCISLDKIDTFK